MLVVEKQFANEAEKQAFVLACESDFEAQLDAAIQKAVNAGRRFLTLSGPSCSGKTTTAHKLISEFEQVGKRVGVVSFDDFFRDREALNKEAVEGMPPDYDSFSALDAECLAQVIGGLLADEVVGMPRYDFVSGTRAEVRPFDPKAYDIILFEGIQAIYPQVRAMFGDAPFYSLYISVAEDCTINGQFFDRRTVRLCRRLVRDVERRSSPPEFTFFLWSSVAKNEDVSILPYEHTADVHINSIFAYEMFMIRDALCALLARIPKEDPFYAEGQALRERVLALPSISAAYLPAISLYREFLG